MNIARKLASGVLALVMVFAFATAAFADAETGSITINDAVAGQTYTIYRILELESYNAADNAYAYKANQSWEAWLRTQSTYVAFDDQGYVTWVDGADAATFAKLAQKYAKDNSIANQGTVTATTTTVSFAGLALGYYLVDTTLGTLCSLDTTNPNVVMKEKNGVPQNVKTVEEDSTGKYGSENDADIGDTVNFQSTITAQAGAENYVFHDTMSAGLTYTGVSGITLNGETVDDSYYTVVSEGLTDGCTFEVRFTQAFCDTLKANDQIVVCYTATVNENAVIAGGGNPNTSKLSYGDSSNSKYTPDSQTKTYTWDVDVFKYTMNEKTEKPLSGAVFTLSKNENGTAPIALISKGNNAYRVAKANEEDTVTRITTDSTGSFTIEGLDSGTYYLTEITAPAGYNRLPGPVTIVIGTDGKTYVNQIVMDAVKVQNQSATELPSTGGTGTTVFYILGSLLVMGAGVLLVTKKRMNSAE